ncbi:MAG: molybdate ABC transporter substrate-binding protein [Mariprofundales bacterium]
MFILFFGVLAAQAETITVAVASSLYSVMQQRVQLFEDQHSVTVHLVAGSTGRLYNQIMQGAPFDLLIAADARRPALLAQQGIALLRRTVGHGHLGIVIGERVVGDLNMLTAPAIHHIVIANPAVAPFGLTAKALLLQHGLWKPLQSKLVYAQSALQARMMVDQAVVDAGLVPVAADQPSLTTIPYIGVLLTDRPLAREWLRQL